MTLNLDFVVHKPMTLMKRSREVRKAKQQGTEVSQIWQIACFVRQMHNFRMPTAFMQFNYVYISLRRVKTRTVRFLPCANRKIPASDSSWLFCFSVVRKTTFFFCLCLLSLIVSSPSLSFSRSQHVKAAGSHKHQLGLLFAYQMCSVVSGKKRKTRSNRRLCKAWQKGEKIIIVVYLKMGLDCKLGAGF